jgi:hypothetical protein
VPAGTWQVSAAKDWQAFAAEQGWDEAIQQQQMAYFAQNGACSALASTAQHAQQVRKGSILDANSNACQSERVGSCATVSGSHATAVADELAPWLLAQA